MFQALEAYNRYLRLCPACQEATLKAAMKIEKNCLSGKHAKPSKESVE